MEEGTAKSTLTSLVEEGYVEDTDPEKSQELISPHLNRDESTEEGTGPQVGALLYASFAFFIKEVQGGHETFISASFKMMVEGSWKGNKGAAFLK